MGQSPAKIGAKVSELFDKRAGRFKWATRFVKAAFIALGAAVAGLAQFAEFPDGAAPSIAQVIGMAATVMAFLGAVYVLITEDDASEELATARRASEQLQEALQELGAAADYDEANERQTYLYQSAMLMRGVIERAVVRGDPAETAIPQLMNLTSRTLPVALGFQQADRWTVCIYRAEEVAGSRDRLICVAHNRAIMCELAAARSWEEGVGVAGIAYANRHEIIIPNMQHAGLGTVFNIAAGAREYDADRYRSISAIPIKVDAKSKPWGVVVATNDRYGHFTIEEGLGPQHVEGVRLLAGMTALAAVACRGEGPAAAAGTASAP